MRQSILILRGSASKKRNFSVEIFQKVHKNAYIGLFFYKAQKFNLVDLKKFFF